MSEKSKNSFTDLEGRQWLLKLNYGLATRIKDALSVDLANAHNGQAFQQIAKSPLLFIQTLTMLVESQLAVNNVTPEQFVEAIDDAVLDQASNALREMLLLFSRAALRPLMGTMFEKSDEARTMALEVASAKLSGPSLTAAIAREVAALDQQIETALANQSTLTASPTSGQQLPE